MTPPVMADRVAVPAFSSPGTPGPNGAFNDDQARSFLVSDQERSSGFVVAQASPVGEAAATAAVDGPATVAQSASRSSRNGQGSAIGESVLKYLEALHENGRRSTKRAPAAVEPAVRLVAATEPGPAAAVLAPPAPQSSQQATVDGFEANLQALQRLQDYAVTVNLAANAVSTATGAIKTLTERMG